MNVYVLIYHDVWDLGRDPGVQNANGEPETTQIDGIFGSRALADAAKQHNLSAYPTLDPTRTFYTIEEHPLT